MTSSSTPSGVPAPTDTVTLAASVAHQEPTDPVERARAMIRAAVIGDAAAQVMVVVLAFTLVDDPLIWVLWGARWVVLLGGLLALRTLDRPTGAPRGPDQALQVLSIGHVVGGIASAIVLPEYAPLVTLVMFGNLEMIVLLPRHARRPQIAIALFGCASTALLGAVVEPSLGDSVPGWLLASVFLSHLVVTGWSTAAIARGTYDELVAQRAHARRVADRLAGVTADERRRIEAALSDGVMTDLSRLDDLLVDVGRHLAAGDGHRASAVAEDGAELAQRALGDLRRVAHGIFPDTLRRHGLAPAVSALGAAAPTPWRVTSSLAPDRRFPSDVEAAAYSWVSDLISGSVSDGEVRTISLDEPHGSLHLTVAGPTGAPSPSTLDRLDAAAGRTRSDGGAAILTFGPAEPSESTAPPATVDRDVPDDSMSDTRIVERFLWWGRRLCIVGLGATSALALATRSVPLALVAATLVGTLLLVSAARRALVARRLDLMLVFVCAETCLSALVVTALVPPIASVTGLITALPLLLALPFLDRRALRAVTVMQTAVLAVVSLIGMAGTGLLAEDVPILVLAIGTPAAAVGVAALVAATLVSITDEAQAQVDRTRAALRTLVRRSDDERRRIERDLHDGAQQHVVAASMQCRALARSATTRPDDAATLVTQLRGQLREARAEVVALVAGAFPEVFAEGRLTLAVRRSAALCGLPTTVVAPIDADVPAEIALPVAYCIHEGLQNAAKHAGPEATVTVRVELADGAVHFEVADDGHGFDPADGAPAGHGLRSLSDRMEVIGGDIRLLSDGVGRGARLIGRAPVPAHR